MPWELTRPLGLGWIGLLGPLLLLYLLKVRRPRQRVSSLWLWQAAERDLRAERPFRRLRASVSLILEALALLALALALAGPASSSSRRDVPRVVVVADVSASMATREGDQDRLTLAKRALTNELRGYQPGTEIMLLAAGKEPQLISGFERDWARLTAAIGRLQVREEEGRLGATLAMASDQLRQRGGGTLLVVSDGAVADAEALVAPAGVTLNWLGVGNASSNTAIVRAEVSRVRDPATLRERVEVFALISHASPQPREVFVTASLRNTSQVLATRRLLLAPHERAPLVLGFEGAPGDAGQGLELRLTPPDALDADDHAALRIPRATELPVVLASKKKSPWLLRALRADPDVAVTEVELSALQPENVPADALLVVDGACPQRLPGNDLLLINPEVGACRTLVVGETMQRPRVTSWNEADPRLRFLNLAELHVESARSLVTESPRQALVRSQKGTLIADASSPGRNATLVGFDLGESDWPLHASFVLFVRNVTELARAHRVAGAARETRTGEAIVFHVPLDLEAIRVEYPGGLEENVRVHEGVAIAPSAARVGFVVASWQGARPGTNLTPVNLASELESQIAPRKQNVLLGGRGEAVPASEPMRFDWLFAALALLLLTADVLWLTRSARGRTPAPRQVGALRA